MLLLPWPIHDSNKKAKFPGGLEAKRPIARIPDAGVVLTRTAPDRPETSVLVQVRAQWRDLRRLLAGAEAEGNEDGGGDEAAAAAGAEWGEGAAPLRNRNHDVYPWVGDPRVGDVALAVWQMLDPNGALVPVEELEGRMEGAAEGGLGPDGLKRLPRCVAAVGFW